MRIETLHLRDFRGINEIKLNFEGKSVILYGINGVGKSTILASINFIYARILNRIAGQRFKQSFQITKNDIKSRKANAVVSILLGFYDIKEKISCDRVITRNGKEEISVKESGIANIIKYFDDLYISKYHVDENNNIIYDNETCNIPIFVHYGVNRLVLKTPLRIRKKESYKQLSAYEKAIENQIAFDQLFEWFLEQELYETQQQKLYHDYEDVSLKAVKNAMLAMLDGYKDVHITARPYSMKVYKDTEALDVLQLSDGEKCTLALFGDIARRLALANPSLQNPLEGYGVVLIDEIELHMHTSWQRKVVAALKKTFPNIQFIITTHSPQVLGEISDEFKVFSLYKGERDIEFREGSYYGVDSNTVLEDAMHTDSVSRVIKRKVDDMYHYIDEKNYDEAEALADEIDLLTKERNADTVRARIIIRKGRRLYAAYTKEETAMHFSNKEKPHITQC